MESVISAVSTAEGRGGVAIVRVSGEGSFAIARAMFPRTEFEPNRMYFGEIDCGELRDFGGCICFRAPHSFTGEDTVEFHCHGGTEIARAVLRRTFALGARPAERGEFTKRAFLNGKLSLSAAEGMADMINARSLAEARAGYRLYRERLTREGSRLQGLLKTCLAGVDADLDYPEEDLDPETRAAVLEALRAAEEGLGALAAQYGAGRKLKAGVNAVICGRPNAGKSTLFNALLGSDRAIVSETAGTTRDVVEGDAEIGGVLFRFYDTAGLRESGDAVEREGVRRAEALIKGADLVLFCKEEDDAPPAVPEGVPLLVVGTKKDQTCKMGCDILVSARTGEGMEELRALLYERGFGRENDDAFLLEERHYRAVLEARRCVAEAIAAVKDGAPAELYAEDVRRAWEALGVIGGETASESVIDEIFSKFCVGK